MRFAVLIFVLALAGCTQKKKPSIDGREWFRDVAAESGIRFEHVTGASGQFYMPEIMGSGCALLDYDNDGDLDALLIQGDPKGGPHRLFRNDGNLHFTDVTAQAGLDKRPPNSSTHGMGAATADFDRDGHVDLLITALGGNTLYRNNGNGTFTDVTAASPDLVLKDRWSTSAAFFDYDRDGWEDLVILNYIDYSYAGNKTCNAPTGETDYCTPRAYRALSPRLFHNDAGAKFTEAKSAGLYSATGPGLGVVPIDANNDGWLDLFVANDSMANHLWINRKNGTFEESALQFGVAYGEEGLAKAGMGVAPGDYDNDGDEDLLVLNLMREGATLFRNDGGGKGYTDVTQVSGLHAITLPWTGFGVAWQDFDRDGRLDLFIADGAVTRREEQRGQPYPFSERNLVIRQTDTGKFEEIPSPATGVSRGAAFGDIDNDGDVDILVNVNHGQARLLRNDAAPGRNWIAFDFPGAPEMSQVELRVTGMPVQTRWIRSSGSYLSASSRRVVFGLGDLKASVQSVTLRPFQKEPLVYRQLAPNQLHILPLRPR